MNDEGDLSEGLAGRLDRPQLASLTSWSRG